MPRRAAALRLDKDLLARVDALAPRFNLPGRPGTRSDALRALVLAGLEQPELVAAALEADVKPSPPAPRT